MVSLENQYLPDIDHYYYTSQPKENCRDYDRDSCHFLLWIEMQYILHPKCLPMNYSRANLSQWSHNGLSVGDANSRNSREL
jgi:hypothetical protein